MQGLIKAQQKLDEKDRQLEAGNCMAICSVIELFRQASLLSNVWRHAKRSMRK